MNTRLISCLRSITTFRRDARGLAATEFALIVPMMLVMFFGTVEISSGVAVDRKVTLVARTLSDLTSQSTDVNDLMMTNFFAAGGLIMWPYESAPLDARIVELWIDGTTNSAKVIWSKAYGAMANRSVNDIVPIPAALLIPNTYLIMSEVNYKYTPSVGYVMKTAVTLSDKSFTRPRQSVCVKYSSLPLTC